MTHPPFPPEPTSREHPPGFPAADTPAPDSDCPRSGELLVYLSWGGEIYGPSGAEDVLAGIRAASFEEDALFWFEGQKNWLPVGEFPGMFASTQPEDPSPAPAAIAADIPTKEPRARHPARSPGPARRRNAPRKPKPGKRTGLGKRGALIIFGFALLAVGLTVGILLLLMKM